MSMLDRADALSSIFANITPKSLQSRSVTASRGMSGSRSLSSALSRSKARVVSADGAGNGDDPSDELMRVVLASVAQYEGGRSSVPAPALPSAPSAQGGSVPAWFRSASTALRVSRLRVATFGPLEPGIGQRAHIVRRSVSADPRAFVHAGVPATTRSRFAEVGAATHSRTHLNRSASRAALEVLSLDKYRG